MVNKNKIVDYTRCYNTVSFKDNNLTFKSSDKIRHFDIYNNDSLKDLSVLLINMLRTYAYNISIRDFNDEDFYEEFKRPFIEIKMEIDEDKVKDLVGVNVMYYLMKSHNLLFDPEIISALTFKITDINGDSIYMYAGNFALQVMKEDFNVDYIMETGVKDEYINIFDLESKKLRIHRKMKEAVKTFMLQNNIHDIDPSHIIEIKPIKPRSYDKAIVHINNQIYRHFYMFIEGLKKGEIISARTEKPIDTKSTRHALIYHLVDDTKIVLNEEKDGTIKATDLSYKDVIEDMAKELDKEDIKKECSKYQMGFEEIVYYSYLGTIDALETGNRLYELTSIDKIYQDVLKYKSNN